MERACPICGQNNYSPWLNPPQSPGPVVRCNECDLVYVNPIESIDMLIQEGPKLGTYPETLLESSDLAQIDGSWEQPFLEHDLGERSAKEANAREALTDIMALTGRPGTLLDIGSFVGIFLNVAAKSGWDCYGIDPTVMAAIYARGYYGLRIITDTLRDDSYPSEFFDVVTAFQVFEHLIDPKQELQIIKNILKPNGLLVIETPNIETVAVRLLGSRHRHFRVEHVSFFSSKTLSVLLEEMDFEIVKVFRPARLMSVRHFITWLENYGGPFGYLNQILPQRLLARKFRINLGDILTVIARKPMA